MTTKRSNNRSGRKDLNLPYLDARPRRAHQERLAAWGLPSGGPRDRLPVPDDATRRGGGAAEPAGWRWVRNIYISEMYMWRNHR